MSFVLTEELARKIEQAEINCLKSRLTAIKAIEGNPMDVELKKFGNAVAFTAKNIPGPSYNKVLGISGEEVGSIDTILDFYREKDVPARFEITPAHATADLLASLSEKGYFQCDFHNALCGSPAKEFDSISEPNAAINIRECKQDEFGTFADIYTKGFGMPSFLKEHVAQNNKVLFTDPHWTFYRASYNGMPAGIGVLYVCDGIGMLAASATLPAFRNKGLHGALVFKRLQKARQLNCHLVTGQAAYGSGSQRNMERAGMKIAYTKVVWSASSNMK